MPVVYRLKEVWRRPGGGRLQVGDRFYTRQRRPASGLPSSLVRAAPSHSIPKGKDQSIMKTAARKKRSSVLGEPTTDTPALTTFSSDLLTPEEERELLSSFWDCKSELVRLLLRQYPLLRANRPPFEPWPMAQFIREFCTDDVGHECPSIRRIHDTYVHFKHRLACAT